MAGDESWRPPRPIRVDRPPFSTTDASLLPAGSPVGSPHVGNPNVGDAPPDGVDRLARRRPLNPFRLVGVGYLALALVVVLVAVVGALGQPRYGSLTPSGGTAFADLRSQPTAAGWSLDLAEVFAPTAPGQCLQFQGQSVDATEELLTATVKSQSPTGSNAECDVASASTPGLVAMADPSTGKVVWTRDLGADLRTTVFSLELHVSSAAGVVVIGVDGAHNNSLVSLDLRTGRTVSSVSVPTADEVIDFGVSGNLVLSVVPDTGGTLDTYFLRRVRDLQKTLWTSSLSSTIFPEMLPDRLVIPMPAATIAISGATGVVSRWGTDLWQNQGIQVTGDQVLAVTAGSEVGVSTSLTLYNAGGARLWTTPVVDVGAVAVSRTCILVSTNAATLTCHNRRTGAVRWTTTQSGDVHGTPRGATTNDVICIAPVRPGDTTLDVSELEGGSGAPRFTVSIPRGATVVGQGATTGYALDPASGNSPAVVSAFDLDSGSTLWTLSAATLDFWGGHLVEIGKQGVARELVSGPAALPRGMLDG